MLEPSPPVFTFNPLPLKTIQRFNYFSRRTPAPCAALPRGDNGWQAWLSSPASERAPAAISGERGRLARRLRHPRRRHAHRVRKRGFQVEPGSSSSPHLIPAWPTCNGCIGYVGYVGTVTSRFHLQPAALQAPPLIRLFLLLSAKTNGHRGRCQNVPRALPGPALRLDFIQVPGYGNKPAPALP